MNLEELFRKLQYRHFDNMHNTELCGISYYTKLYSDLYEEDLTIQFKKTINNSYWILIIDNDFFEDIAKVRINSIEDINKVFNIVGINFKY